MSRNKLIIDVPSIFTKWFINELASTIDMAIKTGRMVLRKNLLIDQLNIHFAKVTNNAIWIKIHRNLAYTNSQKPYADDT